MKARTAIIYGESGTSKTTQLYFIAKYLLKKWEAQGQRKVIRLISADGGGWEPFEASGMIERGEVSAVDITPSRLAYQEVNMLSEGHWPKGNKYDTKGDNWVQTLKTLPNGELGVIGFNAESKPKALVGAYMIESLDSIGQLWKTHMAHDPSGRAGFELTRPYEEGSYKVSGLQQGHWGMIQDELQRVCQRGFNTLPVEYVFYTSKVARGKDDGSRKGEPVYGPATVGQAQAGAVPGWMGDCFHLEDKVFKTQEGKDFATKIAWYRNHPHPDSGFPYLAKIRVLPEVFEAFSEKYKNGYIIMGLRKGLDQFYEWLDSNKQTEVTTSGT